MCTVHKIEKHDTTETRKATTATAQKTTAATTKQNGISCIRVLSGCTFFSSTSACCLSTSVCVCVCVWLCVGLWRPVVFIYFSLFVARLLLMLLFIIVCTMSHHHVTFENWNEEPANWTFFYVYFRNYRNSFASQHFRPVSRCGGYCVILALKTSRNFQWFPCFTIETENQCATNLWFRFHFKFANFVQNGHFFRAMKTQRPMLLNEMRIVLG